MKNKNRSEIILKGVISFLIAALLYNFIWNEFIINPTASTVLEKRMESKLF